MEEKNILEPVENVIEAIRARIYEIRGKKVMLDRDLAELYHVETKRLNEAVKRNIERFPPDFMFQLSKDEFQYWRSQIATSNTNNLNHSVDDILRDQNDINEATALQIDLIQDSLAELHAEKAEWEEEDSRRIIGFRLERDETDVKK